MEVIGTTKNKDLVFRDFKGLHNIRISRCPTITVYKKPNDYPEHFVARLFDFSKPTNMIILKDTLEEIRATIPDVMVRFDRFREDDDKIVECYM